MYSGYSSPDKGDLSSILAEIYQEKGRGEETSRDEKMKEDLGNLIGTQSLAMTHP